MKWLKIHPIPKEEIMESAIKELISEFNEYWEKQDVTRNSQDDFVNMIKRAYEIGKVHSFQDGSAEGFKNGLKVGREEMRQTVLNALDNMAIDIAANSAATCQQIKKLIYNL